MTYKEMESRRQRMLDLRRSGMTYEQISKEIGLSRQRVYQIIGGEIRTRGYTETECVFDGIRNWMNANDINRAMLVRMMYGQINPDTYHRIYNMLRGRDCRRSVVDRLLKVTGLTYEEAFGGVGGE